MGLTVALGVALATGSTVGVAAGAGLGVSLGCREGVAITPCTVGGGVLVGGFVGDGMVVADAWVVDVPVGMVVGCGNSGVVGVFVLVSERSGSGGGMVVISGSGVGIICGRDGSSVGSGVGVVVGVGDGSSNEITEVEVGVTLAVGVSVGVGVAVRQGPSVERARYCDHSSSCIRISRNPPGNDSQISLF